MNETKPARPIRTLLPMACDGVGPSLTCVNLMRAAHHAGYDVEIFANRARAPVDVPINLAAPGMLAKLPYPWIRTVASARTEARFLNAIRPGEIAYLWPASSLEIHRILHKRGIPVVLEGINTRMLSAKRILDEAYEAFGIPPAHGITDERITEQEEKYRYATAIFAPNRNVELALIDSPLQDRAIPASYGVDISQASRERVYEDKRELTFIFCGYACVRKGAHYLLEAWKRIGGHHKLQLVGRIEPVIASRYADVIASDRVEAVGFVDDVHSWFARADAFIFPSLEEGGPQVTYEAAIHGLPIIASPMGASRLGDEEGTMIIVEPARTEALVEALEQVAASTELRAHLGRAARAAVQQFDWHTVGQRRVERLQAFLTNLALAAR